MPRSPKVPKLRYDTIEEIRHIHWAGNHMSDGYKMEAVNDFVLRNYGKNDAACKEACDIVALKGMGIDDPISDEQLADHVEEMRRLEA